MKTRPPPDECANCGAAIPRGAKSCPECGADERTGWRETDTYDGLDLPEEAWREDAVSASTPRSSRARDVNGIRWYWWAAGVALIVILILAGLVLR